MARTARGGAASGYLTVRTTEFTGDGNEPDEQLDCTNSAVNDDVGAIAADEKGLDQLPQFYDYLT